MLGVQARGAAAPLEAVSGMHVLAEKYWRRWFNLRDDPDSCLCGVTDFILHSLFAIVHGSLWLIIYAVASLLLVRIGPVHEQPRSSACMPRVRHGRRYSGLPP